MMRHRSCVIAATVLLVVSACSEEPRDSRSRADRGLLQGEWEIVSAESNGEPPPPDLLKGAKFVFSGEKMTLMNKEGTFKVDASKRPHQIDFVRGKNRQCGIYELDGTCLLLCVGPAVDRPKDFKTKLGTDHTSFVLQRKSFGPGR